MTPPGLDAILLATWFALAIATFVALMVRPAPYGRHARPGFGRTIANRAGWILMEAPAALGVAACFVAGPRAGTSAVFLLLWETHYVYRAFVFPFRLRSSRPMPLAVAASGALFNCGNAYLIGRSLTRCGHEAGWFRDPRFVLGAALFAVGMATHLWADGVLIGLRREGSPGYSIPSGGLYRWVSCPNYLGEIVEWIGWALATWSLAGLAFAAFTAANLVPRALEHHRWYRRTFPDYPRSRRALLPWRP